MPLKPTTKIDNIKKNWKNRLTRSAAQLVGRSFSFNFDLWLNSKNIVLQSFVDKFKVNELQRNIFIYLCHCVLSIAFLLIIFD